MSFLPVSARLGALPWLSMVFAVVASPAWADGLFTLKSENDIYSGGSDGHYTNGLEATWAFRTSPQHWLNDLADWLPGWSRNSLDGGAYRLSHQLYTPIDIGEKSLDVSDRPYAGLFTAGVSLFDSEPHDDWRQLRSLNFDAGIVGPAAGGETIQRELHHVLDSEKPEGWQYQLHNEPVVNMSYKTSWIGRSALNGLEVEYGPSLGFALGNLYTYGATGGGVRIGENLSRSFGIPSIAPAEGGRSFFLPDRGFGWYAFAALEGRYMAHNLLLDGNTFENSHSVDREEWVGDALVGAAFNWDRWQLSVTHAWRTKEFHAQPESDSFGSLSLAFWY